MYRKQFSPYQYGKEIRPLVSQWRDFYYHLSFRETCPLFIPLRGTNAKGSEGKTTHTIYNENLSLPHLTRKPPFKAFAFVSYKTKRPAFSALLVSSIGQKLSNRSVKHAIYSETSWNEFTEFCEISAYFLIA